MNYFVSTNVYGFNNGPEFSSYERLRAFNDNQIPTKLVLRDYSRFLTKELINHHIDHHQVINMYDYFQGITDAPDKPLNAHLLPSIPFQDYHLTFIDNDKAGIDWMGHRKALIHYAPEEVAKVGSIDYYDRFEHVIQTELWDWRGFPSRIDNYHPDGSIATSRYLRRDGSTALVVTHMNINSTVQPTMWKLVDYKGHNYVFDSEQELFTFFLNELNQQQQGTFFADRRQVDNAVLAIKQPLSTVAVIHSVPVKNAKHPENSPLLEVFKPLFNFGRQNRAAFDHIVFPTTEERDVFQRRFQKNLPNASFDIANDSYVNVKKDSQPRRAGTSIVMGYRGMLGTAKNTIDLLKAFKTVSKQISISQLKLQGYFESPSDEKKLKELTQKLGIAAKVIFKPYQPFDDGFFDDVNIFVNPTHSEAFGMNALEAMAAGVPVLTYDVPYIANNLVRDHENGLLLKKRNPRELAKTCLALMQNKEQYAKLSAGALATAKSYDEDALVGSWREVLN